MNAPNSPFSAELGAALQFWRMAGVDYDFADDATDWLAPEADPVEEQAPVKAAAKPPEQEEEPALPKVQPVDLLGPEPPRNLADFHKFWLEAPGLDTSGARGRVLPRGLAEPELMVMVISPEQSDGKELLSGPQGALLENILSAMGLARDEVYIASALPRATPMADCSALAARGMDRVALHHIALVTPKRLIAFGTNITPFFAHDPAKDWREPMAIGHGEHKVPALIAEGLEAMLSMPALKGRFWRRWIEWSA